MRNEKKIFLCFFVTFAVMLIPLLFASCSPAVYYIDLINGDDFDQERNFVISLLTENEETAALGFKLLPDEIESEKQKTALIKIEFISMWEFEYRQMGHDQKNIIIISGNTFVPMEDPLSGRTNTNLEACLDGTETLILVNDVYPPFTALRIDGLAIDDEGYPLVWLVGIKISIKEDIKIPKQMEEKFMQLTAALENAPKPLINPVPQPLWIACGGDLMLDPAGVNKFLQEGPHAVFGATADMLASADLALVNLEGVISSRGSRITPTKSFTFRFAPEIAPALREAGIDAVLHANNHVFDFGETAFLDSLSYLEQAGIGIAGAGVDIEKASEPFVFSKGDQTCYVFGLASFPRERNGWDGVTAAALENRAGMLHAQRGGAEKLKEKFSPNAINIVLFHGGVEMSARPNASTRALYTDLAENGADLIIGSHPHTVQGFEWVHGKPVFWSLGNYVFTGKENMDGYEEGLFIHLGFLNGRLLYMEPFALILTHTHSDIAPEETLPEALETFYRRSRELAR